MKKISCNVIQDLLPLYADQMLSEDSIRLVEEHLEDCSECSHMLEQLQRDSLSAARTTEVSGIGSKKAFKKIQRSILRKRLLAVFVAVALVLAAGRAGYYFYAEKGTYISFEDSGLMMKNDKLYASKPYLGKLRSIYSADQHSMFLIMVDTMQARRMYPEQISSTVVFDFGSQIAPEDVDPDREDNRMSGIHTVYYLPAEYANTHFDFYHPEVWEQQSQEAISKSMLLWSDAYSAADTEQNSAAAKETSTAS